MPENTHAEKESKGLENGLQMSTAVKVIVVGKQNIELKRDRELGE